MPGISIHVVDVASGRIARDMQVSVLFAPNGEQDFSLLAEGRISSTGTLDAPALGETFPPGRVRVCLRLADWYRSQGVTLPQPPFLDVVSIEFGLSAPAEHYHLPFKCTPWGYSCFRGGA